MGMKSNNNSNISLFMNEAKNLELPKHIAPRVKIWQMNGCDKHTHTHLIVYFDDLFLISNIIYNFLDIIYKLLQLI